MKRFALILFINIFSLGSLSAQSFIGKLNPNPVTSDIQKYAQDSLRILAVLADFPEDKDDATFGNGKFGSIYSEDYGQTILDPLPHDRAYFEDHLTFAQNYFQKVSNGNMGVAFTVLNDVLTVSKTMRNYTPPIEDLSDLSPLAEFSEEVWKLADAFYTDIDFSKYDLFIIFHAGVGKDVALPGSFGNERDLPSVYLSEKTLKEIYGDGFQGYPVNGGSFNIFNTGILPETESRELTNITGKVLIELTINGLIAATVGSHLGLPDLYNTETGLSSMGRFGLMDGQSIFTYSGIFAPEMCAWEKMFLGWETPIELPIENRKISVTSRFASGIGDTTLIKIPINSTEYYLIENRKRDALKDGSKVTYKTGGNIVTQTFDRDYSNYIYYNVDTLQGVIIDADEFDWALPGEDRNTSIENFIDIGLIIWHIDERVIEENYESNTINNDKFNRGVSIVEADGVRDIGEEFQTIFGDIIIGEGTKEDTWYVTNPADLFQNKFGEDTQPASITNSRAQSLITMSNFSEIGTTMSFDLEFGSENIELITNVSLSIDSEIKWLTTAAMSENSVFIASTSDIVYILNEQGTVNDSLDFQNVSKPAVVNFPDYSVVILTSELNIQLSKVSDGPIQSTLIENQNSIFSTSPVIAKVEGNELTILVGTEQGEVVTYLANVGDQLSLELQKSEKVLDQPIIQIAAVDETNYSAISKDYYFGSESITHIVNPLAKSTENVLEFNGEGRQVAMFGSETTSITSIVQSSKSISVISDNINFMEIYDNKDSIISPLAFTDLKNDGQNYIVQNLGEYQVPINLTGSTAINFPFQDEFYSVFYSSPLSVDLNDDEIGDIISFTENGKVLAVDGKTGELINGFPVSTGGKVRSIPIVFSENGKTGLALVTEDNQFISWYISQTDGEKFWTEENGNSMNTSFISVANSSEVITEYFPQSEAYNWPNPVYDGSTNIRYYVSEDSDAEVTIFDVAGDLVAKLSGKGSGGFNNEIIWNVTDIQSGVYFAHLKVTSGSGNSDTKIIKIAVVK